MAMADEAITGERLGDAFRANSEPDRPAGTVAGVLTRQTPEAEAGRRDVAAPRRTRRKLWELAHKLHCPVIGTCLDTDELRRIARKAMAQASGKLSDYQVHVSFASAADEKNALSLAAHKALDKKFARGTPPALDRWSRGTPDKPRQAVSSARDLGDNLRMPRG